MNLAYTIFWLVGCTNPLHLFIAAALCHQKTQSHVFKKTNPIMSGMKLQRDTRQRAVEVAYMGNAE
jgi:hypothetical protein